MTRGIEAACWASATRDAEVRQSKAGNEFGIVNLAVNDGSTDADGKPVTTFVKTLAFGQHDRQRSHADRSQHEAAGARAAPRPEDETAQTPKSETCRAEANHGERQKKDAPPNCRASSRMETFIGKASRFARNRPPTGNRRSGPMKASIQQAAIAWRISYE